MKNILFLWLLLCHTCLAGFEKPESGAVSAGLGNATVGIPNSSTAIFDNPAALDTNDKYSVHFSGRNFFGFSNIYQFDLIINCQLLSIPFAFAINHFGTRHYQELIFATASSMQLGDHVYVGLGINVYFLSIQNYGTDNSYGIDLAMLYKISNQIFCGAMITNINKPKIGRTRETLPQSFGWGISYFPQSNVTIAAQVFRDIRYEPDFRLGVSYQFEYPIIIRIGIQDTVNLYCFGFGIHWSFMVFNYALQIHNILGESHIISLSLQL
jgi:hypothetical protein